MYGLPGVWDTPKLRTKCNAGPFFSPNLRVCLGRWLEDPRVELTAMDSKADGHWAILPALHENTVPSPLRCHQLTLSGHLLCGGGWVQGVRACMCNDLHYPEVSLYPNLRGLVAPRKTCLGESNC